MKKTDIQSLIASGQMEEALRLTALEINDAIILQARYSNGKKQYNMGLIPFGEWQLIQNQIAFILLDICDNQSSEKPAATTVSIVTKSDKYKKFLTIFKEVEEKIRTFDYKPIYVENWINQLNVLLNTSAFTSLLEGLNPATAKGKIEKIKQYCIKFETSLKKDAELEANQVAESVTKFAVQDFLNTPTIKGWNNLHLLIRKDFGEGNGWSKDVEKAIVESNGDDVLFCMTFESLPIVGLLKSYYL